MKDAPSAHKVYVFIMRLKYFAPVVLPIYLGVLVIFVTRDLSSMSVVATGKSLKTIALC